VAPEEQGGDGGEQVFDDKTGVILIWITSYFFERFMQPCVR
jgi:hypothetical protein